MGGCTVAAALSQQQSKLSCADGAVTARAQIDTGYRLQVVTVRKLEFENDAFGFADKIIEKCAPSRMALAL